MTDPRLSRIANLIDKLERGLQRSMEIFESIGEQGWMDPVSDGPDAWDFKDLAAHFVSAEQHLLMVARDIAAGGAGAPTELDIDDFNRRHVAEFRLLAPNQLISMLAEARRKTIDWVSDLEEPTLDMVGRHPALGDSSIETIIQSMHGHQLMHMREIMPRLSRG